MVVGILIGLYQSFTQPRMYEAFGRIQVRSGSTNEYKLSSGGMGGFGDEQRKLTTEVAVLTSDTLLISVARDLNLANDTIFLQSKIQGPRRSLDDAGVRMQVLGTLKHNLAVTLVPKTDLIQIKYGSLNAQLSEDIVNKLIEDYVQRTFETRFQSTQRVSRWLSGQLDDLKHQVEVSQNQMLELQKKVGFVAFDATHNEIATSLDDLSKADGTAKLARILAESRYRQLAAMNPDAMGSSLEVGTTVGQTIGVGLPALRSQLATAREQAAQLATSLGPNHPQVKAANAQLQQMQLEVETEEKRLLEQSKQAYLMAKANEDQTRAALDEQKASAYKLQDDMVAYTLQQRNYETNRSLYEELTKRLETAGIQAGLESLEIDVVDRAMLPAYATMTPRSTIISAYTVVGLVIGIMLAFILESLDTGLRSIAEIEGITELPSLAIVPRAKRSTPEQLAAMTTVERNVSVLMQPKSQFTEAFRSLRTALMLSLVGREPKFILFTSATPSEGKTTTASNLAVILSQRGTRVLLIDADLRRPNVHHRFGLNGKLGLSTVLSGQTKLIQSVQQVREVPGLDILASGPVPPFPTEMLSSEAMSDVLREAGEIYTHVIIDSPPVLSVTDGVLLSRQVDAVVLVVRHAKSSKHIVRRGRDLLVRSGAPLVGIVLNAVDLNAPEYYGYYGYTGYSYSSIDPAGWDAQSGSNKSSKKKDKR
jgi:capsular exopolysaccharide synthesis family protein